VRGAANAHKAATVLRHSARLGIVAATEAEAAWVRCRLDQKAKTVGADGVLWHGALLDLEVTLLRCGVGPDRAAAGLHWLMRQGPLWGVLSVGFAGGLRSHLATGDAVLATRICAADSATRCIMPDAEWAELAVMAATRAKLVRHQGMLLSSISLVPQSIDKQKLGQQYGAVAVDMESHRLGCLVAAYQLPFATLRTVFDTSHDSLEFPVDRFTTVDGRLNLSGVLGYVVQHPRSLTRFPSLWHKSRVAGRHLDAWLFQFLTLLRQHRS
jgi:nucleoside phosphorylase